VLSISAVVILALAASVPTSRVRPVSAAPEVLAKYTEDWGLDSAGKRGLIAAVWGDGYAVWSEDPLEGGAPFSSGRLAKERVIGLLTRLRNEGTFDDARLSQANFGPDSRFTTIFIRTAGKSLEMRSWHERAEAGGRLIASSAGLEPLNGGTRLAVLKRQPSEYLYYRAVWGELRSAIQGLLPARGQPTSGRVVVQHGVMTWSEQ